MGLMADVDLKTEHLRWMGDARFVYGFLRGGTASHPSYTVTRLTLPSLRSYLATTLPDKDLPQGFRAG